MARCVCRTSRRCSAWSSWPRWRGSPAVPTPRSSTTRGFVVVYAAFFYTPPQALAYWVALRVRPCAAVPLRRAGCRGQPRARVGRGRAHLLPRRRRRRGRTRAPGRSHAPGERARGPTAPPDRGAGVAAAGGDGCRRGLAARRASSRSSRWMPGACWAPTAPRSSAIRMPIGSPSSGAGRTHGHRPDDPNATADVLPGQPARPPTLRRPHRPRPARRRVPLRAPGRTGAQRRRPVGRARRGGQRSTRVRRPAPEERLREYADLIATAVANTEDRARLDKRAHNRRAHRPAQPPRVSRAAGRGGRRARSATTAR